MKHRMIAYSASIGLALLIAILPAYLQMRDAEKSLKQDSVLNFELMEQNTRITAIELATNCNFPPIDKTKCDAAIKADAKASVEYETAAATRDSRARRP